MGGMGKMGGMGMGGMGMGGMGMGGMGGMMGKGGGMMYGSYLPMPMMGYGGGMMGGGMMGAGGAAGGIWSFLVFSEYKVCYNNNVTIHAHHIWTPIHSPRPRMYFAITPRPRMYFAILKHFQSLFEEKMISRVRQ